MPLALLVLPQSEYWATLERALTNSAALPVVQLPALSAQEQSQLPAFEFAASSGNT